MIKRSIRSAGIPVSCAAAAGVNFASSAATFAGAPRSAATTPAMASASAASVPARMASHSSALRLIQSSASGRHLKPPTGSARSSGHVTRTHHSEAGVTRRGVNVRGGVVHYPLIRRKVEVPWDAAAQATAEETERQARSIIADPSIPARLTRPQCRGCSYTDYCWGDA